MGALRVTLLLQCLMLIATASHGRSSYGRKSKDRDDDNDYMTPAMITKKLLLNNYFKQDPPPTVGQALTVNLGVFIIDFHSINEQTMDYTVNFYLRQTWIDERLSFANLTNTTEEFRLAQGSWKDIWIPDTYFRNEKLASFHEATVANRMLRLYSNGTVWYVTKISAVFACPMNLQFYPLDTQVCPITIESFGYTNETVTFGWIPEPLEYENKLSISQFRIKNLQDLQDCEQNFSSGVYPCKKILFHLQREIGYFLIQVYIPSILIVILSWVSFWIHVDASPARVSIGLLTVLTTTTMSAGARATLPRVSYIKALDVWMIACLVFVFASLIEYAIVNVLSRRKLIHKPRERCSAPSKPPDSKEQRPIRLKGERVHSMATTSFSISQFGTRSTVRGKSIAEQSKKVPERATDAELSSLMAHHSQDPESNVPIEDRRTNTQMIVDIFDHISDFIWGDKAAPDGKARARRVDKISRKVFPIAFVLFNVAYWTSYSYPVRKAS